MNTEELKVVSNLLKNITGDCESGSMRFLSVSKEVLNSKHTTSDMLNIIFKDEVEQEKYTTTKKVERVRTEYINLNKDIEKQLIRKKDFFTEDRELFYTPHIFDYRGSRSQGNVWYITNLFADLDNVTVDEAEERLKQSNLPQPSLKIMSGNGVHFYWKLSDKLTNYVGKSMWLEAQKYISTQLQSDKSVNDTARLLRLPLSYNNKEDRVKVEILSQNFDNTVNLDSFCKEYLKLDLEKATKEVIKPTKEVKKITKNHQLKKQEATVKTNRINNYNRGIRREILKVIDYRENNGHDWIGTRNSIMVMLKKMKFSEEEMYGLNDSIFHLPEKEVANVIKWEDNDKKFMRRKTVYETLNITEEDMVNMNLKYLINEAKAEENKRLKKDLYSKVDILCVEFNGVYKDFKDYLQVNYVKKIKSDKKSKKTNKDIANVLNISVRGVSNIMKKTAVDKNEMIGKLLDINAKSLDLIEIANKEKGELNQENIDKLNNLIAKLDRLIDLVQNNDEIDAKNRFKIVKLKKKYNDLLALSIVA